MSNELIVNHCGKHTMRRATFTLEVASVRILIVKWCQCGQSDFPGIWKLFLYSSMVLLVYASFLSGLSLFNTIISYMPDCLWSSPSCSLCNSHIDWLIDLPREHPLINWDYFAG